MKIEFDVKDPRFKVGDIVLSIYSGVGSVSSIISSSITLQYSTNKPNSTESYWSHTVYNNNYRLIAEKNLYLLSEVEKDIRVLGISATAHKLGIDVGYIQLCESYIANWNADGQAEAAGS